MTESNSLQPAPRVVGRLAPSPTGAQHVGNARTYLLAWLSARSRGGRLILRIEDIDSPRVKAGAAEQIMEDLRWLGLDWDEGPYYQTQRLSYYHSALAQLQQRELVYPCTCSRGDIEQAASAPHLEHEGPAYPGTCAGRRVADAADLGRPFAWRFRSTCRVAGAEVLHRVARAEVLGSPGGCEPGLPSTSAPATRTFLDGFRGKVDMNSEYSGDFVVWKNTNTPAYQLAVVVDDAAMGITEVLRGDDLIPSTPRQLELYAALGHAPPAFVHVPLVVGPDGRRLAKRHGDTRLATLRAHGVSAENLLGLLAWSCGWLKRIEPIPAGQLLPLFRLDRVAPTPFVLTADLLAKIGYG